MTIFTKPRTFCGIVSKFDEILVNNWLFARGQTLEAVYKQKVKLSEKNAKWPIICAGLEADCFFLEGCI